MYGVINMAGPASQLHKVEPTRSGSKFQIERREEEEEDFSLPIEQKRKEEDDPIKGHENGGR